MKLEITHRMYKKIKRSILSLFAVFIACQCFISAQAIATCDSINIKVYLKQNGDAYIEETWDMNIDEGTKIYKDESQLRDCEIKDLKVVDQSGVEYTTLDSWDVQASFEEKKYKCGLNELSKGYEICWGVSQYGRNRYTISYTMTNFINSYNDYDGFNQRLVNDEMGQPPRNVNISIYADGVTFRDYNTKYQAMGFSGEVVLYDDHLQTYSNKSFSSDNHATILMRFDKGMFSPTHQVDKTYAEVEKEANEGSGPNLLVVFGFVTAIGLLIVCLIYIIYFYSSARKIKKLNIPKNDIEYFRDIPFNGDFIPSYFSLIQADELKNETDIIGAYLLKWLLNRNIRIENDEEQGVFRKKQVTTIRFENKVETTCPQEKQLYDMLYRASGRDHILQEDEFEKWTQRHYEEVSSWLETIKLEGENYFREQQYVSTEIKKGFFNLIKVKQSFINDNGVRKIKEVLGLKLYLKEFTIINERSAQEVYLWKDYLIYASMFGIASEVSKQFKELYPTYFEEYFPYYSNPYYTITMMNRMNRALYRGYSAGYQSSSSTSFASGGGGGGFSGGGSGGGVR